MKIQSLIFSAISLLSFSALAMNSGQIEHALDRLDTPARIVINENGDFHLLKNGKDHQVQRCWVDPLLKSIKSQKQAEAFNKACYVRAVQMSDNNYKLLALGRLQGGGVGGAAFGIWLGKAIVYGVSYGTLGAITAAATVIAGPAGTGAMVGVTMATAPFIEAASNVLAIGLGITGAVATGPV